MPKFEEWRQNGLPAKESRKIGYLVGCIMASALDNDRKKELVDFVREIEKYLENEVE